MRLFDSRRKQKRASLQLSINAIVILVMAMVVLGLGLTFIRGLFDKGTDNLTNVIENTNLKNPASSEEPVTIDSNIKIKQNDEATIDIGFYNVGSEASGVRPGRSCGDSYGGAYDSDSGCTDYIIDCISSVGVEETFPIVARAVTVSGASGIGFNAIIRDDKQDALPTENTDTGKYACTVEIVGTRSSTTGEELLDRAQFFLNVES